MLIVAIQKEMERLASILLKDQSSDGSWNYAFETGIATDAYTIILLRSLEIHDEGMIQSIVKRLLKHQENDGSWKLFRDQPDGDLSSTIQAYYALSYSGYVSADDPRMQRSKSFIIEKGGIDQAGTFTQILLALTGQYDWSSIVSIPIEIMLFPPKSALSFYDFSVFGRANIAPILILQQMKYKKKSKSTPDLSGLYVRKNAAVKNGKQEEWRNILALFQEQLQKLNDTPEKLKQKGIHAAKEYMLKRIEPDGTLLCYYSATFFMIFALLALGYSKKHSVIERAIQGIKSMGSMIDSTIHMQYTTADVWNTSLISHTLQDAGIHYSMPNILKANHYLMTRQQFLFGDWVINNPETMPGGWGFSNINTLNPDVDDTTASLKAIRTQVVETPVYQPAWKSGIKWVLSMQNTDGGWPAFERGVDKKWLALAPIQGAEYLLLDPSTADLTGRTLEFLGNYTHLNIEHPAMKKGVKWLEKNQREDGSWYGRWGICYIYGTWAALTGMAASGKGMGNPAVDKAIQWLRSIQNEDGGWGESCNSDIQRSYIPLGESTLTQTAWAVDALIAVSDQPSQEIMKGIGFLIQNGSKDGWTERYPKGQGMAAGFYIHYHSYRYIWPLMALSNFLHKYST